MARFEEDGHGWALSAAAWLAPRFTRLGHEAGRRIEIPDSPPTLLQLAGQFQRIPGMISADRGIRLYMLAYASAVVGDVIEVGCWLGRTTSLLAAACRDSHNGIVRPVDNFLGAPGREATFARGETLGTQVERFRRYTSPLGEYIRLYQQDSHDAAEAMTAEGVAARMIVIDGNHSYEGVNRDIADYLPLLQPGGIVYSMTTRSRFREWYGRSSACSRRATI